MIASYHRPATVVRVSISAQIARRAAPQTNAPKLTKREETAVMPAGLFRKLSMGLLTTHIGSNPSATKYSANHFVFSGYRGTSTGRIGLQRHQSVRLCVKLRQIHLASISVGLSLLRTHYHFADAIQIIASNVECIGNVIHGTDVRNEG